MAIFSFGPLLLAASLALATPALAQQARVSARAREADSLVLLRGELQRVTLTQQELMRQLRLVSNAMRRPSSDAERANFRARIAELTQRLERSLNDSEMLQAHMEAKCAEQPAPEGWLGINFSETMDVTATPSATTFVFRTYPKVLSVEPGSPAQKAGLASGDEIVALGGQDMVSRGLNIGSLLKPGVKLPVRYRRDGEIRTMSVLVEPRPEGFMSHCPWIEIRQMPAIAAQPKLRVLELPNGEFGYVFGDSTGPKFIERIPKARGTPVLPPTPYAAPFRLRGTIPGQNVIVAGAVLVPLSEGLREGLGLDDGILVFDVLRGSPALDAGLREGDVIVGVNGRKVTSIGVLVAALDDAIDREVELQVSRRNAKRIVRLRP
ncbi:MAG: PDZ domain-containing protein [Gemmatimonadaceae bacterium]